MISDAMKRSIPSVARVDARALVRGGRAVVVVLGVRRAIRPRAASAAPSRPTCSTGSFGVVAQPLRRGSCAASCERSAPANVETMISSTRSSWTACIAAVYGSGCAIWPCASMPSPRSTASARRSRRSASGCSRLAGSLCGQMIRKLAGERAWRARGSGRAAARRRPSRSRPRARSPRRPRPSRSTTTCSTGTAARARRGSRSTTFRRSQPDFCSRVRRDDDLVGRRLELRERVAHRVDRIGVDDEPVRGDPRLAQLRERPVEPPAAQPRGACPRRRRSPRAAG